MGLELKWGALTQVAEINAEGDLNFDCPFCGKPTFLEKPAFVVSGKEVRTTTLVRCSYDDCNVPFEIVHSHFVPYQLLGLDKWMFYRRWNDPARLRGVWKSHNERRKRREPD